MILVVKHRSRCLVQIVSQAGDGQTREVEVPLLDHLVVLVVISRVVEAALLAAAVPVDGVNHPGTDACVITLCRMLQ